jgi:hypothetical protein
LIGGGLGGFIFPLTAALIYKIDPILLVGLTAGG